MVEDQLKAGELPCLVATSSLELGIDMGAVDLVLQVESPKSVTAGLQRIGRAGHNVGETSKGRIFPKFRADLLECAVVAKRMREGLIETTVVPRNPLDVLAQQIVAMAASTEDADGRRAARAGAAHPHLRRALARAARERARHARRALPVGGVRRAAPADRVGPRRRDDPRPQGLARAGDHQRGHDPRPRAVLASTCPTAAASASSTRRWSTRRGRARSSCSARRRGGSRRSPATASSSRRRRACRARCRSGRATRVGPPARARRGDRRVLALGGRPGRGDARARLRPRRARGGEPARVPARAGGGDARRPERAHDRVERFRDEIGDWRLCILSPYGGRVHAAWGLALSARIRDEYGLESDAIWSDDGIIVHLPDADEPPGAELVLIDPDELEDRVVGELGGSRAVRRALPRERRPRAADPARLPGPAHAAVAAAAEVADAARGRQALRAVPDRARDLPRVPARRARPAGPDRPAAQAARARAERGRGRDADGVAVRVVAAVRLRGDLHVRGRHAERGAPRGGAGARPRAAARAARPGGAARADRRGRAASRSRTTCSESRSERARNRSTRCTTCCGGSAS